MIKKDNVQNKIVFWRRGLLKRGISFLLSTVLVMTNIGNPANLAFGASDVKEEFRIHKDEILQAIEKAWEEGTVFDGAELKIDGKDRNLVKNYKKLLEENTVLMEIHPEMETVNDVEGIDLRIFVCLEEGTDLQNYALSGEEKLVFLYVNEGEKTVSGRINVDGYVTNFCTLKSYEYAFGEKVLLDDSAEEMEDLINSSEDSVNAEGSEAEESTNLEETKEGAEISADLAPEQSEGAEEADSSYEDVGGNQERNDREDEISTDSEDKTSEELVDEGEQKETKENSDSTGETESGEEQTKDNSLREDAEEKTEDKAEVKEELEEKAEEKPEIKEEAEEKSEAKEEAEEKPEMKEEPKEKPEVKEEQKEKSEEKSAPKEEQKEKPEEKSAPKEEQKEKPEEKSAPKEEQGEKPEEKSAPKEEQKEKPESRDEGQEKTAQISRHSVLIAAASASDADKEDIQDQEDVREQEEMISFNRVGVLEGRTYGLVAMGDSMSARAFVVSISKLGIASEEIEENDHQITYTISPAGSADLIGAPEFVSDEAKVSFGVKPFSGYQVNQISANGIILETAVQENSVDEGIIYYEIPEVLEDQEVEIVMIEEDGMNHPQFFQESTINGVTITISAEEGILPEGTRAVITEVTSQVEDAVKEKEGQEKEENQNGEENQKEEKVYSVLAYDIKLVDQNGIELDDSWSRNGYVDVAFSGSRIEKESKEADAVEIRHLDLDSEIGQEKIIAEDINELEKVGDTIDVSGDRAVEAVAFSAEHFSVYVVNFTVKASGYAAAGTVFVRIKDSNGREIVWTEDNGQKSFRFADELGEVESAGDSQSLLLTGTTGTVTGIYSISAVMSKLNIGSEINVGETRYRFDYAQAEKNSVPTTISNVRYYKSSKVLQFKTPTANTWTAFKMEDGKAYIDLIFAADSSPKMVTFNFVDEEKNVLASSEKIDALQNYFGTSRFSVLQNYKEIGVQGIQTDLSELGIDKDKNNQLIKIGEKYYWITGASAKDASGNKKTVDSIRYYWNNGKDELELQYVPTSSGSGWKALSENDGVYEISIQLKEVTSDNLKESVRFNFIDENGTILKTETKPVFEFFSSGVFSTTGVNGLVNSKLGLKNDLVQFGETWYSVQNLETDTGTEIVSVQYYWDDSLEKLAFRYKSSSSSSKWNGIAAKDGSYAISIKLIPCANPVVKFHIVDEDGKNIQEPVSVNAISELVYTNSVNNQKITEILKNKIQGFEIGAFTASDGNGYVFKNAKTDDVEELSYIAYHQKGGKFELKYGNSSSINSWTGFENVGEKVDVYCEFAKIKEKVIFHIVDTNGNKIAEDKELSVYPALKGSNGASLQKFSDLNNLLTFNYANKEKNAIIGDDNKVYAYKEASMKGITGKLINIRYYRSSDGYDFKFGYKISSGFKDLVNGPYEVNLKFEKLDRNVTFICKWGDKTEEIERELTLLPDKKMTIQEALNDMLNTDGIAEKEGKKYILNSAKVGIKSISGIVNTTSTSGVLFQYVVSGKYSDSKYDFGTGKPTVTLEFVPAEKVYFNPVDEEGNIIDAVGWKEPYWTAKIPAGEWDINYYYPSITTLLEFGETITDTKGRIYHYKTKGTVAATGENIGSLKSESGKLSYRSSYYGAPWKEVTKDTNGRYTINLHFAIDENAELLRTFVETVDKLPDRITEENIDHLTDISVQFDACASAYEKMTDECREKEEARKAYKKYLEVRKQYQEVLEDMKIRTFIKAVDKVSESIEQDLSDSLKEKIKEEFAACDNAYAQLTAEQKNKEEAAEAYKTYLDARTKYQKKLEESIIEAKVKVFTEAVEKVAAVSGEGSMSKDLEELFKSCDEAYEKLSDEQKSKESVVMAKETLETIKKQYYASFTVKINVGLGEDIPCFGLEEAIKEVDTLNPEEGEIKITLKTDIDLLNPVQIKTKNAFIIDLNGKTINYPSGMETAFQIEESTVVFKNGNIMMNDFISSEGKDSEISSDSKDRTFEDKSLIIVNGNVVFEQMVIDGGKEEGRRVLTVKEGTAVLSGGTIIQNGNIRSFQPIPLLKEMSGGGVYVGENGNLIVSSGAVIQDNQAYAGGGIYVAPGGNAEINGGKITNNISNVKGTTGSDKNFGGLGGGIYIADGAAVKLNGGIVEGNQAGTKSDNQYLRQCGAGGGIYIEKDAAFTMNNGTIISNHAYANDNAYYPKENPDSKFIFWTSRFGGGICIQEASEKIRLNSGRIEGNDSAGKGGGIYIHTGELHLEQVKIAGNKAEGNGAAVGSGIWYCDVGDGRFYATSGGYISNNARVIGTDFYSREPETEKDIHLPTRLSNGTNVAWYEDDGKTELAKMNKIDNLDQYLKEQNTSTIMLISKIEDDAETGSYSLTVSNNQAVDGGGIACNGSLIIGKDEDITIKVKKIWKDENGNDITKDSEKLPDAIKVDLWRLGKDGKREKKLDADVKLSAENLWSYEFRDLPATFAYEVAEQPIDGWEMERKETSGEDGKEVTIIIVNKEQPKESPTEPETPEEPTTPDESTPEETTPEESSPEESTPEESTPEETTPQETQPPAPGNPSGGGGGGRRRRITEPTPPPTAEETPIPPEEVPLASIEPEEIPLAMLPPDNSKDLTVIDDGGVPLFGLPRTGDKNIPTGALIGMMFVSLMTACGIHVKKRKEKE